MKHTVNVKLLSWHQEGEVITWARENCPSYIICYPWAYFVDAKCIRGVLVEFENPNDATLFALKWQ